MPYHSVFKDGLFDGQSVIVTGGGSGIGRCTAHELIALGARVALVGRRLDRLETVADALGKRLVVVEMNLRETRFAEANWSGLTHAAALAAAGLTLERGYGTLLIPSSAGYRDLRSWGSHPLTDPLFSTSGTDVLHDGPAFMRVEKTEYVTESEVALAALRVCWKSETGDGAK